MVRWPTPVSPTQSSTRIGCPMGLLIRTRQLITGKLLDRAAATNGESNYVCFISRYGNLTTIIFTITTIFIPRGTLEKIENGLIPQTQLPFWRVTDDDFLPIISVEAYQSINPVRNPRVTAVQTARNYSSVFTPCFLIPGIARDLLRRAACRALTMPGTQSVILMIISITLRFAGTAPCSIRTKRRPSLYITTRRPGMYQWNRNFQALQK